MTDSESNRLSHRTASETLTSPYVIDGMPNELQISVLDRLVGMYDVLLALPEYQNEERGGPDVARLDANLVQDVDRYLQQAGINTDPQNDEGRAEYELTRSVIDKAMKTNERDWIGHTTDDGGHSGISIEVFNELLAHYRPAGRHRAGMSPEGPETDPSEPGSERSDEARERTSEEWDEYASGFEDYADQLSRQDGIERSWDEAHAMNQEFTDSYKALDEARKLWAAASAKRQGRVLGKAKDHTVLEDAYTAKLREFGVIQLQNEIANDDDDTTKNAKVIGYLFNEQKKLRELTTEKLKGTKVGKFVEFMNRGRLATRIAKGVGLGLAVGATGGFALGAVGAAGAGAAAIGFSRFVKGYASNDKHRGMRTAEESFIDSDGNRVYLEDDAGTTIESKFDTAARIYDEDFEKDTKREQIKRRKALAWGIGSVAIGTSVGYLVSNFDEVSDKMGDTKARLDNWLNDTPNDNAPTQPNGAGIVDHDHDGIPDGKDPIIDSDGDGIADAHDAHPHNPNLPSHNDGNDILTNLSHNARWVEPSEGWYQTFNELGIPQDNWQDVLQDAGPKLHEQGWAYRMPDGQWGISQPGRLPDSALRIIAESSKDNGYKLAA